MSFTRSQQGIFRPMVARAWLKHAAGNDLNPRDKAAQNAWYRAELQECLGCTSTKDADPGRDFETVMAHFEVFVGGEFYWNLRVHQGDCRRLQFAIRQICERWEIDDQYACATAARVLKWEGHLDSLSSITKAADLQRVRIALLIHARRKGKREDQPRAAAKLAANPALNVPPAPEIQDKEQFIDDPARGAVEIEFESPGVRARREAAEETSRQLVREARAAGLLSRQPRKPRAKRPAPARSTQPAATPAQVDPDNCPF